MHAVFDWIDAYEMSTFVICALSVILIIGVWHLCAAADLALFRKAVRDDDSYFADPATPLARVSPPSEKTARPEDVHPLASHADRVSAIGDQVCASEYHHSTRLTLVQKR